MDPGRPPLQIRITLREQEDKKVFQSGAATVKIRQAAMRQLDHEVLHEMQTGAPDAGPRMPCESGD